eukprot:9327762-Pyramimonas_sp.AAC.1
MRLCSGSSADSSCGTFAQVPPLAEAAETGLCTREFQSTSARWFFLSVLHLLVLLPLPWGCLALQRFVASMMQPMSLAPLR